MVKKMKNWLSSCKPLPNRRKWLGRGLQLLFLCFYGNWRCEGISHAWYRHNILRTVGIRLDFLAQVANVSFDQARIASFVITPDALDDHIGSKDLPGMGDQ